MKPHTSNAWSRRTLIAGVTAMAESGDITAGNCTYRQAVDNAHPSSNPRGYASVHGWWKKRAGTCPSTADVDVYLQAAFCDTEGNCGWRTIASGNKDVKPGGGANNRANARNRCADDRTVGYRDTSTLILNGVSDPDGYTYSPGRDIACYPA